MRMPRFPITPLLLLLVLAGTLAAGEARAQTPGGAAWEGDAETSFHLPRGTGRSLMTQQEWQEHHQKMRALGPEEREQYQSEWHVKMMERAKERGITMPPAPPPERGGQGKGMGHGMGGGGMGRGGGPGQGRGQ